MVSKRTMRKFFKPWVLVASGVIMNIVSALIVHTFVERNMHQVDDLMQQSSRVDSRIDTLWENYRSLQDQQMYFTTLLLTANPGDQLEAAQTLVRGALSTLLTRQKLTDQEIAPGPVQVAQLDALISAIQQSLLQQIDAIYLEKLSVEQQRMRITESNERLNSIALFLQLLGLILVLARDLARRD